MSTTTEPLTRLRVLCLHDSSSNAAELETQLFSLGERLFQKHGIDLVYINSPLTTNGEDADVPRMWWEEQENSYVGLDASLMLLQQIWGSSPFWGIVAVGQGAAVASILIALLENQRKLVPPHFSVFISGKALVESQESFQSNTKALHLMDMCASEEQERLTKQYPGTVKQRKNVSIALDDLNSIGRFIISQKNSCNSQIVRLQNELHEAEQQASELIASQIALNPPPSLMAIIQPEAVAGWNKGRKHHHVPLRGAPCPTEFTIPENQRHKQLTDSSNRNDTQNE